ncbi:hypothetical protein NLX83_21980 [Allokutzneria sp. A3M-2-11 16]|uniref:hypothetical protein n=1 Tax=Allokutzneria sp. A3M-2-11 16 TaxID=2962043 RepID=UPI0020B8D519|nr:hypothetical protein [Allokutzneria sp. A3M-2-11 16]MCP3801941.1 hypothetical protein [Allokutzneria sp. A3M-2-11 16]
MSILSRVVAGMAVAVVTASLTAIPAAAATGGGCSSGPHGAEGGRRAPADGRELGHRGHHAETVGRLVAEGIAARTIVVKGD